MGGICSRTGRFTVNDVTIDNAPGRSFPHANGHANDESRMVFQSTALPNKINSHLTPSPVGERDKQLRDPYSNSETNVVSYGLSQEEITDGIPRMSRALSNKSRSTKSKQAAVAKVGSTLLFACFCSTVVLELRIHLLIEKWME